jgi:predicted DNA-binding transcriptional regulator YafY
VLLRVDLKTAAGAISPTVGNLEARGDATLLRIGANELEWIAGYLAGLPFDFEVLNPPELRKALRALASRLRRS